MIERVQLKNWRSHLDSTLDFSLGTNALFGPMGSGKSSVMNAISFALFGTFPDLQSRKMKLDDLIMNKPSIKNESQISLDFIVDGKKYTVMRVLERNKGTTYSEIRENDKLLDSPNSQRVTELVEKILKINYETFSRIIYSEQNELDYFLRLPKGERMKKIDNLLMIDKFENARSGTVSLKNKLIERRSAIQNVVDINQLHEKRKIREDFIKNLEISFKKVEELNKNLEKSLIEKSDIDKKLNFLEEQEKKLKLLELKKKSLEGSIKEIENSIKKSQDFLKGKNLDTVRKDLSKIIKSIEEGENQLKLLKNQYENLMKFTSAAEARLLSLKEDEEKLRKRVDEKIGIEKRVSEIEKKFGENIESIIEKNRSELEILQRDLTETKTKFKEINESLEKISKIEGECPICKSKVAENRKKILIKEYQEKIDLYKKKIIEFEYKIDLKRKGILDFEKINNELISLKEKLKIFENIEDEIKEKKKIMTALEQTLVGKKEELLSVKNSIEDIQTKLNNLNKEKQNLESIIDKLTDLEENKSRLEQSIKNTQQIEKQISEISNQFKEEDLKFIREKSTEISVKVSEISLKIENTKNDIEEKNRRIKEIEEEIKKTEIQIKNIDFLDKLIKDISIFEEALEKTQTQLRENFIEIVNYTLDQIWPVIYTYSDKIGLKLAVKDRDYVLQIKNRNGDWIDLESDVSGGERSLACLALRIAFSSVLAPQLRWLFLDEPTHNLDTKAIDDLSQALRDRVQDFAEQVFLITHDRNMENAVTGQLYRLNRNKEIDDYTRIERLN